MLATNKLTGTQSLTPEHLLNPIKNGDLDGLKEIFSNPGIDSPEFTMSVLEYILSHTKLIFKPYEKEMTCKALHAFFTHIKKILTNSEEHNFKEHLEHVKKEKEKNNMHIRHIPTSDIFMGLLLTADLSFIEKLESEELKDSNKPLNRIIKVYILEKITEITKNPKLGIDESQIKEIMRTDIVTTSSNLIRILSVPKFLFFPNSKVDLKEAMRGLLKHFSSEEVIRRFKEELYRLTDNNTSFVKSDEIGPFGFTMSEEEYKSDSFKATLEILEKVEHLRKNPNIIDNILEGDVNTILRNTVMFFVPDNIQLFFTKPEIGQFLNDNLKIVNDNGEPTEFIQKNIWGIENGESKGGTLAIENGDSNGGTLAIENRDSNGGTLSAASNDKIAVQKPSSSLTVNRAKNSIYSTRHEENIPREEQAQEVAIAAVFATLKAYLKKIIFRGIPALVTGVVTSAILLYFSPLTITTSCLYGLAALALFYPISLTQNIMYDDISKKYHTKGYAFNLVTVILSLITVAAPALLFFGNSLAIPNAFLIVLGICAPLAAGFLSINVMQQVDSRALFVYNGGIEVTNLGREKLDRDKMLQVLENKGIEKPEDKPIVLEI